jgi:hypothetical protein
MTNERRELKLTNASFPIRDSFEPGSKDTSTSDVHSSKQSFGITSTFAGIQIDLSDEQLANVPLPNSEILQSDSNMICEREEQSLKHSFPNFSIEAAIQTDLNVEQSEKAHGPISLKLKSATSTVYSEPKYRISVIPSTAIRNLSETK